MIDAMVVILRVWTCLIAEVLAILRKVLLYRHGHRILRVKVCLSCHSSCSIPANRGDSSFQPCSVVRGGSKYLDLEGVIVYRIPG